MANILCRSIKVINKWRTAENAVHYTFIALVVVVIVIIIIIIVVVVVVVLSVLILSFFTVVVSDLVLHGTLELLLFPTQRLSGVVPFRHV